MEIVVQNYNLLQAATGGYNWLQPFAPPRGEGGKDVGDEVTSLCTMQRQARAGKPRPASSSSSGEQKLFFGSGSGPLCLCLSRRSLGEGGWQTSGATNQSQTE